MHAVILVGGRGLRLLPFTKYRPKPLVRLGRYSILEIIVRRLRACGFERVTLCTAHLDQMIRAEFGDGGPLGVAIDYCTDDPPSGTAGPLLLVPEWNSPAVVMNGDVLTALDFADFRSMHEQSGSVLSVAFQRREVPVELGVLEVDSGQVHAMWEKPSLAIDVCSGMYVVDPSVRDHIPEGVRVDMPDVINALLAKGKRVNAYGFCEEWYDIGTPTTYRIAEREFLANPDRYISRSPRIEPTGLDRVSTEVPPLPTGTDGRAQLSVSTVR